MNDNESSVIFQEMRSYGKKYKFYFADLHYVIIQYGNIFYIINNDHKM